MEDYLFINEVAQLHGLTKKTLLYYDKIDLFKPSYVDHETGYRYYSHEQLPFLKQIIYLKDLGFSLEDIHVLLKDRSFPSLIEKLNYRLDEVIEEKKVIENMKRDLEYLINYYQKVQFIDERDLYKPGIKIYNNRYAIYQLCEKENSVKEVMLAYRSLLRTLISLSILSQMEYGTIVVEPFEKELLKENFYDKIGAFITLPKQMNLEGEVLMEAGKYAYMYKKGGYYDPDAVLKLMTWIEENGYTAVGNIYDYSLVDYTFTKSNEEMIQEIQIRIV